MLFFFFCIVFDTRLSGSGCSSRCLLCEITSSPGSSWIKGLLVCFVCLHGVQILLLTYMYYPLCVSALTVKNEGEDETLKDEMAQQYKAIQYQQLLQLPFQPATSDAQLKKKSSTRSFKKFFGKWVSVRHIYYLHLRIWGGVLLCVWASVCEQECAIWWWNWACAI